MIRSIKHKGLKLLFEKGNVSKLPTTQIARIEDILSALNVATVKEDMNAPGSGFHELKGDLKGFCAVKVTGNYRIVFRLENGDVFDVDYLDYH